MKKLLLSAMLISSMSLTAQETKQMDLSIKHYDILQTIKGNDYFKFIGKHDKESAIYDGKGVVKYYEVYGEDYLIRFNSDNDIVIGRKDANYYLTIVGNDMLGHGFINDKSLNRLLTYYFQNKKVIADDVIKNRS